MNEKYENECISLQIYSCQVISSVFSKIKYRLDGIYIDIENTQYQLCIPIPVSGIFSVS